MSNAVYWNKVMNKGLHKSLKQNDELVVTHNGEKLILKYNGRNGSNTDAWSIIGPESFEVKFQRPEVGVWRKSDHEKVG